MATAWLTLWVAPLVRGVGGGLLLGLIGGQLGRLLGGRSDTGWGDLVGAITGAILGYLLGVALGVMVLSHRGTRAGAFWRALLGSGLGGALVLVVAAPLRLNQHPLALRSLFILLPPMVATLVFNVSGRRR